MEDADWSDVNDNEATAEPSEFAYPNLLGKMLDVETINAGSPGASNKEIWDTILRTKFTRDDRVCVMWSHSHRTCQIREWPEPTADDKFVWEPRESGNYNTNTIKAFGNWMNDDKQVMSYYEHVYDEVDAELTTLLYANHIDSYLRPRITSLHHASIPNCQLVSPRAHDHTPEWDSVYKTFIDTSAIYNHCPKTPCRHFGKEAHQKIANLLHSKLIRA